MAQAASRRPITSGALLAPPLPPFLAYTDRRLDRFAVSPLAPRSMSLQRRVRVGVVVPEDSSRLPHAESPSFDDSRL